MPRARHARSDGAGRRDRSAVAAPPGRADGAGPHARTEPVGPVARPGRTGPVGPGARHARTDGAGPRGRTEQAARPGQTSPVGPGARHARTDGAGPRGRTEQAARPGQTWPVGPGDRPGRTWPVGPGDRPGRTGGAGPRARRTHPARDGGGRHTSMLRLCPRGWGGQRGAQVARCATACRRPELGPGGAASSDRTWRRPSRQTSARWSSGPSWARQIVWTWTSVDQLTSVTRVDASRATVQATE